MNPVILLQERLRSRARALIQSQVQRCVEAQYPVLTQVIQFQTSPREDRQSYCDHTRQPLANVRLFEDLKRRLVALGVPVVEADIDLPNFETWLASFPEIRRFYRSWGDVAMEKCMEHYLTYRFLDLRRDDVFIDVAAASSPWAKALARKKVRSYRLDLGYRRGVHGRRIGADAGDTSLPAGFATAMASHCAFECFMGDADVRFMREASRVLGARGRYAIVPLYLDDAYFVTVSPYCDQKSVIVDSEAKRIWRDDGYAVPFARHYSPESFYQRVYSALPEDMTGRVLYFRNLGDIMERYEGQRLYCFFMFFCEKLSRSGDSSQAAR